MSKGTEEQSIPSGPGTSFRAEPRGHREKGGRNEETGNRTWVFPAEFHQA